MNKKIIGILLLLSLVGLIFSGILLNQHLTHLSQGFEDNSICDINKVISCKLVDASPYSTIRGIPMSGLGLVYYILVIIFLLKTLIKQNKSSLIFALMMSLPAFVATIGMAYLSFVKLKLICLFCSGMYVVNLGLLIGLLYALKISVSEMICFLRENLKSIFGHSLFSLLVLAGAVLILNQNVKSAKVEWQEKQKLQAHKNPNDPNQPKNPELSIEDILKLYFDQKPIDIDTKGAQAYGNTASHVSLVEFSDFECPYCKKAADFLKPVLQEYGEDIGFYFINYPLDRACNKYLTHDMHKMACEAAKAGYCAGKQGKFWDYYEVLFASQPKFEKKDLISYAGQAHIDSQKLETCLDSVEALDKIKDDVEQGQKSNIHGTPSLFINGRPVSGWNNLELFKAILDEELKRANH